VRDLFWRYFVTDSAVRLKADLGNGILRPETRRGVQAKKGGQTRQMAVADRARPC
jgi:hypothetical protein